MADRWPEVLDGVEGPVWDLPTATDVRRRGNRLARRRTGWAVAAGTVAVAAIAVPLALGTGPERPAHAPVATDGPSPSSPASPVAAWRVAVPDGFSIAAGMRAGSPSVTSGAGELVRTTTVCGEGRWVRGLPTGATDGRVATGEEEQRILLLYPDAAAARGVLAEARRTASACDGDGDGGRRLVLADDVGGDESWALALTDGAGDTESVVALRVGNAVLLDHASLPGRGTPASVADGLGDRVEPVAHEMCVFAEEPCRR